MKKIIIIFIVPFLIFGQDLTYVPDDNFEQRLIDLFFDDVLDDYVLTENISSVEELYINNSNISDLTGLEDFINLKTLNCNFNPDLLSLDLSNNTELISISSNQIWGIENGSLEYINVSNCSNLETLTCLHSQVTSVDVSDSPNLIVLNIGHNLINSIDISNNILLETIIIDNNLISQINVTNNSNLNLLDISDNPNLTCADLRNGNNTNITGFYSTGSTSLYCINVDDSTYSTNNWNNILSQHYFSNDCGDNCDQPGCTDPSACNYNPEVNIDNGICLYPDYPCEEVPCFISNGLDIVTISVAFFNDDCECIVEVGCTDPSACNYIETATTEISDIDCAFYSNCYYSGEAFVGELSFNESDIPIVTNSCGEISEECECCYVDETVGFEGYIGGYICGCMDINACNYDQDALLSNNSCLYDDGCVNIFESLQSKNLVTTIDILGKLNINHKGFQLEIYDDGSIEKK
ncbi:MAG: hypothetical protein CMP54_00460, partial [Flavobacteriales bacterium]|nr:hypothetical protein [Flavobacteriales bacterium]